MVVLPAPGFKASDAKLLSCYSSPSASFLWHIRFKSLPSPDTPCSLTDSVVTLSKLAKSDCPVAENL